MYAALNGRVGSARLLIDAGADKEVKAIEEVCALVAATFSHFSASFISILALINILSCSRPFFVIFCFCCPLHFCQLSCFLTFSPLLAMYSPHLLPDWFTAHSIPLRLPLGRSNISFSNNLFIISFMMLSFFFLSVYANLFSFIFCSGSCRILRLNEPSYCIRSMLHVQDGRTALDVARQYGNTDIVRLLLVRILRIVPAYIRRVYPYYAIIRYDWYLDIAVFAPPVNSQIKQICFISSAFSARLCVGQEEARHIEENQEENE